MSRPLAHDETYNTFIYLNKRPVISSVIHRQDIREYNWQGDWRRQVILHPPGLSFLYYNWIRVFGDSELSLRIVTFFSGLAALVVFYLLGILVFDSSVVFMASLALCVTPAYVVYSLTAVHAIFELLIFLTTLLVILKYISCRTRRLFWLLFVVNAAGAVFFYHYFIVLFMQLCILWRFRAELKLKKTYFVSVLFFIACFLTVAGILYSRGLYKSFNWQTQHFGSSLFTVFFLPFTQATTYGTLLLLGLFVLFVIGATSILRLLSLSHAALNVKRAIILAFFIAPILVQTSFGLLNMSFGHNRNFVYLLPVYMLIAFYGASVVLSKKIYYYVISGIIIVCLAYATLLSFYSAEHEYLERACFARASASNSAAVIVLVAHRKSRIAKYYSVKSGIGNRLFVLAADDEDSYEQILKSASGADTLEIIQGTGGSYLLYKLFRSAKSSGFTETSFDGHAVRTNANILIRKIFGPSDLRLYDYKFIKRRLLDK